jgi:hypothetical protein
MIVLATPMPGGQNSSMRPKSENPKAPGSSSPNSAVRQSFNSAVICQGSVELSPLDAGITGINPATPHPPVRPSEADIARSHLELANATRRCASRRADGQPCGSPALHGEAFCHHHRARRAEVDAVRALPPVTDPVSFQRALQQVLSDTYSGRLRARTAGQLLFGLQMVSLNLPAGIAPPAEIGGDDTV